MMKKIIVLACAIVAENCSNTYAMHDWYFRLSHRACSWWHKRACNWWYKKDKQPDEFPNIDAFDEFGPLKDKNGRSYPKSDLQEFDNDGKFPIDLRTRCSKLAFIQNHSLPIFGKDRALLNFARTMAKYEKKWNSWHTDLLFNENTKQISMHTFNINVGFNKQGEPLYIRQDYKSPYYKFGSVTDDMYKILDKWQIIALNTMSARENTAYHDELKFLYTQLHKMELYWNMKSNKEHEAQKNEYRKTYDLLQSEIEKFKIDQNRTMFTRSFMKKSDFTAIQSMRKAYAESEQKSENLL
ncbi:MAG TPA: hypothetical protein VGW78_00825 [Candidatus Babeliales bacterium]|nr:hypothetical protein [Candidatus Babeliales bacterium]